MDHQIAAVVISLRAGRSLLWVYDQWRLAIRIHKWLRGRDQREMLDV